jgi:hypothetical protein
MFNLGQRVVLEGFQNIPTVSGVIVSFDRQLEGQIEIKVDDKGDGNTHFASVYPEHYNLLSAE